MKVTVLGLGYIGLPTAIVLARAGHQVYGYDVNARVIKSLSEGHIHIVENDLQSAYKEVFDKKSFIPSEKLMESEAYIISVPTPFKGEKEADLSYVDSATEKVASVLKEGNLVVLESTSPPGTTKRVTDRLVELTGIERDKFYTAHCPERVLPGRILYELVHNDRIIGSEKKESALMAKELYSSFVTEGNIYITNDVTAEMSKLVENSFRDVNIAFANELSILCDELGIDVHELISLANKHPRVNILNPGIGVGGHCISVDPWFIVERFKNAHLIKTARQVNDFKPIWVSRKIEEKVLFNKDKIIAILGLSYKPDIDDLRESPSVIIAHDLIEKGYQVIACEPNVDLDQYEGIKLVSLDESLKADVIVLAQKDKEFKELNLADERIMSF